VPDSIQGLVENNRWFETFVIPPDTYPSAQEGPVNTVAVKEVLVCRAGCPNVYNITGALVDDEVRLRSVVRGVDLHNPLQDKNEPSIPLHADALQYYWEKSILPPLPPKSGVLSEQVLGHLVTGSAALFVGSLIPWWRKRF